VATPCRVCAIVALPAEAVITRGAPELTSIAPYTCRSRMSFSAAAVSVTGVTSKAPGRRRSRAAPTWSTAAAGPATAIGTSWTDERTDGQTKAVSSTLMITVSRATTRATAGQGDFSAAAVVGVWAAAMSTP
jgi:hypothetical protein